MRTAVKSARPQPIDHSINNQQLHRREVLAQSPLDMIQSAFARAIKFQYFNMRRQLIRRQLLQARVAQQHAQVRRVLERVVDERQARVVEGGEAGAVGDLQQLHLRQAFEIWELSSSAGARGEKTLPQSVIAANGGEI